MKDKIDIPYLKCTRCKHKWVPRKPQPPKECPKCRSPYWDRPIERKKVSKIQKKRER